MDKPFSPVYLDTQTARASAVLEAAGAWDTAPTELFCYDFASATLSITYTRGAAGGAMDFYVETSPYTADQVGVENWFQIDLYEGGPLVAGADTGSALQQEYLTYASGGAAAENFTYSFNLGANAQRVRIVCRESGVVGNPGTVHVFMNLGMEEVDPTRDGGQSEINANTTDTWRVSLIADEAVDDSDKVVYTVPADTEAQILWVWVELATDATVANRQLVMELQDSANDVIGRFIPSIVQAASVTYYYMFGPSVADLLGLRDSDYLSTPIPPTLILQEGDQVRLYDNNVVAVGGDDLIIQMQIATRSI